MTASSQSLSEEIDRLLGHYLSLLDQYTTIRTQLSLQQISTQQNLARAKFHAPPGVHYGESSYDTRIQATRRCRVTADPESALPTMMIVGGEEGVHSDVSENEDTTSADDEKDCGATDKMNSRGTNGAKDPIIMFGFLAPEALRKAQSDAVEMVSTTVPQLCAIDAEMREVEIKIRRARKYRAKAEENEQKEVVENVQVPTIAGLSIEAS